MKLQATRLEWKKAYRIARIIHFSQPNNEKALCRLRGVDYIAWYTVRFKRDSLCDPLMMPIEARLMGMQLVNEILREERRS